MEVGPHFSGAPYHQNPLHPAELKLNTHSITLPPPPPPSPLPRLLDLLFYLLSVRQNLLWAPHGSGFKRFLSCNWPPSLSLCPQGSAMLSHGSDFLSFLRVNKILVYVCDILFIRSSTHGLLVCFPNSGNLTQMVGGIGV